MRRTRAAGVRIAAFAVAGVALAGCGTKITPSMLHTHGSEAQRIAGIWWLMFGLGAGVYAIVGGFVVWAILRGRRHAPGTDGPHENTWIVWGGVIVPVAILAVLAVVTVQATAQLRKPEKNALQIEVIGKRWWWEVHYIGTSITTANEIHMPANRPVEIHLDSDNVIHSFWVPELAGKEDVIPGQHNVLRFTPRTPGSYIGECAEFCGVEHARMGFVVVVQNDTDFTRWMTRDQLTPLPPDSDTAAQGQLVFSRQPCAGCHTIRGTSAQGSVGPDLTDFGGRQTIGARTLANTPSNLAAWIKNPQHYKPGSLMPPSHIDTRDLDDLVTYLEGLK
jgi:cytochrome c oxidase subunit 2